MKKRLDHALVEMGLVNDIALASAYIMEARVEVNGIIIDKPGYQVNADDKIKIKSSVRRYVSRGGIKLEGAIHMLGMDVRSKIAMDIGSSTGGFTDCLLQHGAERVYAIDVGYGLLDYRLRQDKRVIVMEGINFRFFDPEKLLSMIDIATIDVSFISLELILPNVLVCLKSYGHALALVKPQFELEQADVGKGGIVTSQDKHYKAIDKVRSIAEKIGFKVLNVVPSVIKGSKGNQEFFIYMQKI
ncbi:MAG: TlyA family RNA methyltransferase [bacterium]